MAPKKTKGKAGADGGNDNSNQKANPKSGPKNGKGKSKSGPDGETGKPAPSKLKAANSINVRHILCEKFSKKEEALQKLGEGVKFDEVAREYSEDKARQGGSLGWKIRGSLLADFENVAFDLEPSTVQAPRFAEVKTREGYHIVMVEGRR